MKLYELPRNTYFSLTADPDQEVFLFKRIDGMYSVCYNKEDDPVHIAAYTDVQIVRPTKTYIDPQPAQLQ